MKLEKKELPKRQVELTIRVTKSDALPHLLKAASDLSIRKPIKGFRPGKAPYEIMKREFGEAALLDEALDDIINNMLSSVLETEKIEPFGKIGFDLLPVIDPEEAVAFKAIITLMPTVKLGNWQKNKIKRQTVSVTDDELNKALDELAAMTTTEEPVDRAAAMNDKAVVDFEVAVDGKVIDGGTAQDFGLVLGEGRMIPGFEEKIVGAKAGDKLEFTLNFPEKYGIENLNGKLANFKITVKQVLARTKPEINDKFAKRVGVADLMELKSKLRENIQKEKDDKEEERVEIAAIKQLNDSGTFSDFPPEMIGETAHDLVHEFEHTLAHQGMKFDQYLSSIRKTEADLIKEFEPKAVERIKSSLALGQLAEDEKIEITTEEVEAEIAAQQSPDKNQPEYRRHVANSLINRKIINFLKEKIVE